MTKSTAIATTKPRTTLMASRHNQNSKSQSTESAPTSKSSTPKFPLLLFHETAMTAAASAGGEQVRHNTRKNNKISLHGCCSLLFWYQRLVKQLQFARQHPYTVLGSFMLFAVLLAFGLYLSYYFKEMELDTLQEHALSVAEETALFFSNQLDAAVLPIFSLAHFVSELSIFSQLEDKVGYDGTANALPLISETHRNVSGVCDDPNLVNRFNKIAHTLKSTAHSDGILVNLILAPDAVVCLLYPLNNTEDFAHGKYLDNSKMVGHDLLADPDRRVMAESTLTQSKLVVDGPLAIRQCPDCDPIVEKAFVARLPINSLRDDLPSAVTINQANRYGKWGFAIALIHWDNLVIQSGIYENFEEGRFEFQLTRTDQIFIEASHRFDENTTVLAESSDFASTSLLYRVQTSLPTANNEWEVTVAYCTRNTCLSWFPWAITASVLMSLFISILVYTIFMQKQRHSDLIEEKSRQMVQAAKRMARNERELNDFIAQYVMLFPS
jgi:sensor domain CHASE-containing protein